MGLSRILNKISLKKKLFLAAIGVSIMLAFGGFLGVMDVFWINLNAQDIGESARFADAAMEMEISTLKSKENIQNMIISTRLADIEDYSKTEEESRKEFYLLTSIFLEDEDAKQDQKELVQKIKEMHGEQCKVITDKIYLQKKDELQGKKPQSSLTGSSSTASLKSLSNEFAASNKMMMDELRLLEDMTGKDVQLSIATANKTYIFAWYQLLGMISFAVIFTLAISIYFTSTISKPLRRLEEKTKEIAKGDLKTSIDEDLIAREDEIGGLSKSIETVITSLREIVSKIKDSSRSVSTIGETLSIHSSEVKSASEQVSYTIQEMSKGNQNLSASAYANQKEAETLMSSIEIVTNSVHNSMKNASEANAIAMEGSKASKTAMAKIELIKNRVSSSATTITQLNEKVQKINRIVEVITSVSEQTNLLALNAAIEAARAGESGRGFAVVADEVRKLAEESQKSTSQIDAMIKEITESTAKAAELMQKGSEEVDDSIQTISGALNSLELISGRMSIIASDVDQINKASERQTNSSKNVQKSIIEVSSIAEESAAGAEEVVATSLSTTNAMKEIADSAKQLAEHSQELKNLVEKFRI